MAQWDGHCQCFSDIRGHLEAIRSVDMTMIVTAGNMISPPLQEEELRQILACKLSMRVPYFLRAAIHHVPENIPRVVDGVSLRLTYIF